MATCVSLSFKLFPIRLGRMWLTVLTSLDFVEDQKESQCLLCSPLSRKAKGSNNRQKAVKEVAKVHEKIANTRQDFLHKLSRKLCDENQIVVAENLSIKGLARTKLAKSIHEAGFGMLLNFLDYKLKREGGKLVEVDRFYPSTKLCSCVSFK